MAIAHNTIVAYLSFWCHYKALGWKFCLSKYQISRVNSFFTIEKGAIPDPSQKVPKNEDFSMNGKFTVRAACCFIFLDQNKCRDPAWHTLSYLL